jgi:hypothetical protein
MSDILLEMDSELSDAIIDLQNAFDTYDFTTASGLNAGDLDGISGFESIAVITDKPLSFRAFKQVITHDFYSNGDNDLDDFDWDALEDAYELVKEKYASYREYVSQIEDNLTGDQTIDNVEILDVDEVKSKLLEYMIEQNLVYEIDHPQYGTTYLLNDSVAKCIE